MHVIQTLLRIKYEVSLMNDVVIIQKIRQQKYGLQFKDTGHRNQGLAGL